MHGVALALHGGPGDSGRVPYTQAHRLNTHSFYDPFITKKGPLSRGANLPWFSLVRRAFLRSQAKALPRNFGGSGRWGGRFESRYLPPGCRLSPGRADLVTTDSCSGRRPLQVPVSGRALFGEH